MPPHLVIGREGEIGDLDLNLRERVHVLVTGPRRIGKSTVCQAACEAAAQHGHLIVSLEVPERRDASELLRKMVEACGGTSLRDERRRLLRALRPLIAKTLTEQGLPVDLSELGAEEAISSARTILGLPLAVAGGIERPVVLFLDEIQRIVDYDHHEQLLADLLDLYTGQSHVTVIADGSDERTVQGLLGPPNHLGKLFQRYALAPTIPRMIWEQPLRDRFHAVQMDLTDDALTRILDFGQERPYATMLAAQQTALTAKRLDPVGQPDVGYFEAQSGIDSATKRLLADGA